MLAATQGRGVDAILDVVGSDYLGRNVECLAPDGHLVIIGGDTSKGTVGKVMLENRGNQES